MNSKYIPNKKQQAKTIPFKTGWTYQSNNYAPKEYVNHRIAEKERIEAIPLEQLTFKDLYQFPFHQAKYGDWVYDLNSNFIFQFENVDKETRQKFIDILNGDLTEYNRQDITSQDGEVFIDGNHFITIRGWGNLTGVGAYNLDGEYAAKIQDTLLDYILEKLKK